MTGLPEYIGREVARMTVYETIMVVLGVIGALISLSKLAIALLNYLDKRNSKRMSLPKPLFTAILSLSHYATGTVLFDTVCHRNGSST